MSEKYKKEKQSVFYPTGNPTGLGGDIYFNILLLMEM